MTHWGCRSALFRSVLVIFALAVSATIAMTERVQALPSYARQTGQPCGTCHTDFPALTPFGRRFKMLGYTTGGGEFRTTPFARRDISDLAEYVRAIDGGEKADSRDKAWGPPISAMAILGFTHTQAPLSPPTDPYKPNDNVVLSPVSFFWGGAVTEHIGAFAQVTYNAPPAGGFADPLGHA